MAQDATRRAVLALALSLPWLATGCEGLTALGTPPRPAPDTGVAADAIAREGLMIARYDAVIAASPQAAALLAPVKAQHTQHLAALRKRLITPHGMPHTPTSGLTVPHGTHARLAWLADAETAAANWLVGQLEAVPPSYAQLLASIAASEATHAAALSGHGAHR